METITDTIDYGVIDKLRLKYPDITLNEPTWAEGILTAEFRSMAVGDVKLFPIPKYNYNTLRVIPCTTLVEERIEGWKWTLRIDSANKSVTVLRIA